MVKVFPPGTSQRAMLQHRRAWKTKQRGVYRVYDRAGVPLSMGVNAFGVPYHRDQVCPGGQFEADCWHRKLVARRLVRDIKRGDLIQKLQSQVSRQRRLAQLQSASDKRLMQLAGERYPGRDYSEILRLWGRRTLIQTVLRFEGYAA